MNSAESPVWLKSSYSDDDGNQCVEVATGAAAVHVRDSKDVARPGFRVSYGAWAGFVGLASEA
ncbi:DUF397 domain-containing protein [Streptomyces sp. NPDC101490]|uniref:DUF397 domain-containing protein n=1 Tax=unclassified Streptomyces TaxID=2593676 RepID=UPI0033314E2C